MNHDDFPFQSEHEARIDLLKATLLLSVCDIYEAKTRAVRCLKFKLASVDYPTLSPPMNSAVQHQPREIRATIRAIVALCLYLMLGIGFNHPAYAEGVKIVTVKPRVSLPAQDAAIKNAIQVITSRQQMDSQTLEAVLQEFDDMRRTNARDAAAFVVHAATPERIDRLYQMPEVALIPKSLRENGLIFAGLPGSRLLSFKKPSDIIAKVSAWFPDDIALSRKNNRLWRGEIDLQGPFENWETEPATFIAMWNCVPQIAWLQPDRSPFRRTQAFSGLEFMLLGGGSSDRGDMDFGQCVREKNGYRGEMSLEGSVKNKEFTHAMADRVVPTMQEKFADFLKTNRCHGTGPDDCVLVLHLWASLMANDQALAAMLQSLEVDIALDSPLPAMQAEHKDYWQMKVEEGADRFDEVWRRAAFLRTKLVSILGAPSAWPSDALNKTLQQLMALQLPLQTPYADRFYYRDMNYRAPAISPWLVLYAELRKADQDDRGIPAILLSWRYRPRDPATLKRVHTAVIDELSKQEGKDCEIFKPWLTPELKSEYVLSQLSRSGGSLPQCVHPDWPWLVAGASKQATDLRARYLSLIPTATEPTREVLLSYLSNNGNDCFGDKEKPLEDWQRQLCKTWIHEPQTTPPTLKNSQLTLDKSHQFQKLIFDAPKEANSEQIKADQADWLAALTQGIGAELTEKMQAYAANLHRQQQWVRSVTLWRHPGHSRALAEIELADNESTREYLALAPHALQKIEMPPRLKSRNDDQYIWRVSDLDEDGNLELWWARSQRDCRAQYEEAYLLREGECPVTSASMGEISGSVLSYFTNHLATKKIPPAGELWTSKGKVFPLPEIVAKVDPEIARETLVEKCNQKLIGAVLAKKIAVDFGGESETDRGDIIDIVCKKHPQNSQQTLVALFHDIPGQTPNVEMPQKGFVIAVLDDISHKVLSLYQDVIEEDGSTRISSGSLVLDTARYHITPKLRAFGVRMNIGYSPRYAEGGENDYLWLFIEEGKLLRPILKNRAMSSWTMVGDGAQCIDNPDADCTIEYQKTSLALAPTSTHGWRDLDIITTTRTDTTPPQKSVSKVTGRLRAKNKMYQ